jgi:hypothetical protein
MRSLLYTQVTGLTTAKLLCAGMSAVSAYSVSVPGGGYSIDNVITVSGGTFLIPTTLRVAEVTANGGVRRLDFINRGLATAKPSNAVATTVAPSGGTGLTLTLTWNDNVPPSGTHLTVVQAEAQNVRWRDDGGTPTAAVGMILLAAGTITNYTDNALASLRVIEVAATAKLNVTFYG